MKSKSNGLPSQPKYNLAHNNSRIESFKQKLEREAHSKEAEQDKIFYKTKDSLKNHVLNDQQLFGYIMK